MMSGHVWRLSFRYYNTPFKLIPDIRFLFLFPPCAFVSPFTIFCSVFYSPVMDIKSSFSSPYSSALVSRVDGIMQK